MQHISSELRKFRFEDFELDLVAYELRRGGRRVRLERRPMDLLVLMVQRRGELITRAEIVERLWDKDVFIEVDSAVNTLVRKIRHALGDSSDSPTFVETVPGKGYRFIAQVAVAVDPPVLPSSGESSPPVAATGAPSLRRPRRRGALAAGLAVLLVIVGAWGWQISRPHPGPLQVAVGPVKVAVLPFVIIRVEPGREYLADALQEDTIAALAQVSPGQIEVTLRRSTLKFRNSDKPVAQIAQELGVEYLVESSIVDEHGDIRVTAKLIRARDGQQIWTRAYDDQPRSILEFQRDLSVKIADEIHQTLSPARIAALGRRHTANAGAVQLYFEGLAAWNQLNPPQSTQRAIELYRRATQVDPTYALPWSGLAIAYAGAPINADADPRVMGPLARQTAQRAISANPDLAEAQTAAGAVSFWFDWDWPKAEAQFRKAVAMEPTYAFGQRMVGILLSHQGRHDEAQEEMRRLLALEPDYEMNWALRAQVASNAREFSSAAEFARQAAKFQPAFWIATYHLALAQDGLGRHAEALQTLAWPPPGAPVNSKLASLRGYLLAKTGRTAEARAVLNALKTASGTRYVPGYAFALIHAGLGERDAAFAWLERAYEQRDVHLIALGVDVKWDPFREDPRFAALLAQCGFTR